MAEKLNLPELPTSPLFVGSKEKLTTEWQEFFRVLFSRVGGTAGPDSDELDISDVAQVYSTPKDHEKRIDEIEQKLNSLPTPRSYDRIIEDLKRAISTQPSESHIGMPHSSTDNAIARWDGTLGTKIQDSGITIGDDDTMDMDDNRITELGSLDFTSATELTISSGAITLTGGHHSIDTESDAADDDLDTISGGNAGEILLILAEDDARTVRLRNGVGNIFLKHQTDSSPFAFSSPSGAGAATRYAGGGWYDFPTADANLNQAGASIVFGTANVSYAAHASIIAGGVGVVDTGVIKLTATGTTIDDEANRSAATKVTIVADITTLSTDDYVETSEKFLGQVTFALETASGSPVNFSLDFNYGLSKYEDFANQGFTVTGIQIAGEAGASDSGVNFILFHHNSANWTYAATGFVPGGTQLANMNTDHNTEIDLVNGEPFAWKRVDLNTDIDGSNGEGVVVRIDTSAAKAVESMSGIVWVHTAPAFSYLADTKQHLIFMKHGPNWLEL